MPHVRHGASVSFIVSVTFAITSNKKTLYFNCWSQWSKRSSLAVHCSNRM